MRYFLDIAYRGTTFHGWQIQPNASTVQEEINKAVSMLLQQPMECLGSGRTDTGVHASQQIAHLDIHSEIDKDQLQYRLNALLPQEISVNGIRQVKEEAHARFDATSRSYEYHIHKQKNPFKTGLSYFFNRHVDIELINQACELIKGWQNFQAFSKVHTDVKTFDCTIHHIEWKESNDSHVFSVSANRFLRGMVRAMVGTLLEIGQNKMSVADLEEVLKSGIRSNAGRSAPPEGLFLTAVDYPKDIYID
ncbi:MAG: tRNA pseudouridine(38-40) synthase TruA [Flammeovirgaceae bacterium]|nr:tRNA pseudouridine(38-40) synthase TruA [Flammeovirgaceae bacterium]MBE61496.1 tRNA pseudouridine(38-40) synthase TruA [Flammeovirgaceae bacterium]MBR06215.1 tRNA pseudouridine(38-40) synthase TruA [Rickettsiales bacterium]HCX20373.1 tRNA pseudouridine(38-40) synthase TruA [Cytophagales bacterium]